jgi:hypothetical protein
MSTLPVPPIPDASIPLIMADGKINPDWYRWHKAAIHILKTIRSEIP